MIPRIVFCDVDGTLLSRSLEVLPGTLRGIRCLQRQGIPFVIISGRSPSGIYPLLEDYHFRCPIICYSGALILNENREVQYCAGMDVGSAARIIAFLEEGAFDCSWNVFCLDQWIVRDKSDPRIIREERIVRAQALQGTVRQLAPDAVIGKILCICHPDELPRIEAELKKAFPQLSVARSSDILLEVMAPGITKSSAVRQMCSMYGVSVQEAAAFGDHFNDAEMLETVGMPFLMGNAPAQLRERFRNITDSNDEEGIFHGLERLGLV